MAKYTQLQWNERLERLFAFFARRSFANAFVIFMLFS